MWYVRFFCQAEDGIRCLVRSRGLGDVYKRQAFVNEYNFLLERALTCEEERGHIPNFSAVDFYAIGDLFRVVDTLNGLP